MSDFKVTAGDALSQLIHTQARLHKLDVRLTGNGQTDLAALVARCVNEELRYEDMTTLMERKLSHYNLFKFRGLNEVFTVFAEQKLTPDDVMQMLIDDYQPRPC